MVYRVGNNNGTDYEYVQPLVPSATRIDGVIAAGDRAVEFDARALAGGVYFYRLRTPNFLATKKQILTKQPVLPLRGSPGVAAEAWLVAPLVSR